MGTGKIKRKLTDTKWPFCVSALTKIDIPVHLFLALIQQ